MLYPPGMVLCLDFRLYKCPICKPLVLGLRANCTRKLVYEHKVVAEEELEEKNTSYFKKNAFIVIH